MIETQELHKNFGNKVALSHLSLNIKPGERVALIGQNGCGKTTLLRCLLGHYNYQGKVLVFEKNPRLDRVAVLSRVAFVPQHPPALKSTVQEFTHMVSQLCGIEISQIITKANALGLDIQECSNRPIKNLSGGMKQKLLIAAAFSRNPELLIMDEPAANLDPQARACFFEQLLQLPPSTTMLLSSHRVDELSGLVTRVLEMDAGKIAVDGFVSTGNHGIAPSLSEQLDCVITLNQVPEAVSKNLREWGFKSAKLNPERWEGSFNAADRFRFLAMVTRWSGLIKSLTMKPSSESNATLSHGDGESKRQ